MSQLRQGITGHYEVAPSLERGDCVVAHSFGTETNLSSVNARLARTALLHASSDRPLIVDSMIAHALPLHARTPDLITTGLISTRAGQGAGSWGTWIEAIDFMNSLDLRTPVTVAQAFHAGRVAAQGAKLGVQPLLPRNLPRQFDRPSKQLWTKTLLFWAPYECIGQQILKRREQL